MSETAPRLRIRTATAADVAALLPGVSGAVRAMAAEWDGNLVAVFGICFPGAAGSLPCGFADIVPGIAPQCGAALVAAGRRLLPGFARSPVMVVAAPGKPTAPRLLRCLGFNPFTSSVNGDVWRYEGRH